MNLFGCARYKLFLLRQDSRSYLNMAAVGLGCSPGVEAASALHHLGVLGHPAVRRAGQGHVRQRLPRHSLQHITDHSF